MEAERRGFPCAGPLGPGRAPLARSALAQRREAGTRDMRAALYRRATRPNAASRFAGLADPPDQCRRAAGAAASLTHEEGGFPETSGMNLAGIPVVSLGHVSAQGRNTADARYWTAVCAEEWGGQSRGVMPFDAALKAFVD